MVPVMNTKKVLFCSLCILLLSCFLAGRGESGEQNKKIENELAYLIDQIAKSHLTFIRNGVEYSGQEASAHIKNKCQYFKSQIKTPEDFIRVCASKSIESGKPYLVSTAQGKISMEKWLGEILAKHLKEEGSF